jgi:sucrose-phosphate synthase
MKSSEKEDGLYILMLSIHGLVRSENIELGRDADTGGQIKYVIELIKKLSKDRRIARVDLLTRKVISKKVDPIYAQDTEKISSRASIIRLHCGPRRYLRKEVLWPYLDSFSDQAVQHIRRVGRVPDLIHAHYADAGYVGGQLARLLGVPFVFTGHSLGRVKRERLLKQGVKNEEIEQRYNISHRIDAEEFALDTAVQVVASTHQEVEEQYKLYENYDPKRMGVIPPGIDLDKFYPVRRSTVGAPIHREIDKFLKNPKAPIIFTMSRADERKNIETLVHAFGKNSYLRENANLLIIAGNREDIRELDPGARRVLGNILYLIDKYDLYGRVAYPKMHKPDDVPEMYRIAARTKGVFVNPALTEPFGLTLLEAAASGLPLVSTNDGGPRDILGNCKNGELVDPNDEIKMGKLCQKIIVDRKLWNKYSANGLKYVRQYYSWKSHIRLYISKVRPVIGSKYYKINMLTKSKSRLATVDRLIISDIDHTLVGDAEGLRKLIQTLRKYPNIAFGIATGRRLESAVQILKRLKVPVPDILITAVGSEINYGKSLVEDRTWKHHLNYFWQPEMIREILDPLPGLKIQEDREQRKYKISYYVDAKKAPKRAEIVRKLRKKNLRVKVIHSHDRFLDILPIRASKGLAVRYLAIKWGLPLEHILVAGDSGNDEEMLSGDTLGVVVGNYSPELKRLQGKPRVYFARSAYAQGILEGLHHYNFFEEIKITEDEYKEEEDLIEKTT